jgi:hypothetical protein
MLVTIQSHNAHTHITLTLTLTHRQSSPSSKAHSKHAMANIIFILIFSDEILRPLSRSFHTTCVQITYGMQQNIQSTCRAAKGHCTMPHHNTLLVWSEQPEHVQACKRPLHNAPPVVLKHMPHFNWWTEPFRFVKLPPLPACLTPAQ